MSKRQLSLTNGSRHDISDASEPPSPRPSRSNSAFTPVNTSQQTSSEFSPRLHRQRGSSTPTSPVARRHSFNRSWTLGESPGSSLKSVKNSPPGSGKTCLHVNFCQVYYRVKSTSFTPSNYV